MHIKVNLGILTGASLGAVLSWEKGKFKPRAEKKAALATLRKFRKRELRKILAEKAESKVQAKNKPEDKGRKKKTARKVMRKKGK
jgi:hypothetical protein